MEDGSHSAAEQYTRYAISLLEPGQIALQIQGRQRLVDAIKGATNYVGTLIMIQKLKRGLTTSRPE